VYVQDVIAVVGNKIFPPDGLAAHLRQLPRYVRLRHGKHLDRDRELAEHSNQLGVVDYADKFARSARKDLLARQGATAALHQLKVFVGFVGTVDIQVQISNGIEQ
jgi:hypothetical protein